VRKDLVEKAPETVPSIFRYKTHLDDNSMHNTPPCFAIYMTCLTTRWLMKQGGVEGMEKRNRAKAGKIYQVLDTSKFYRGTAVPECRSDMNITFRLPSEELEEKFVKEASGRKLKGLKGHRSVGGIRASVYNAFPEAGVDALVAFMKEFEGKNG
jgi:phosphoserine aminotransferase